MKLFDRLGKLRDRRRPYCTMIVPAAGESRRMGGGNKLLLPLEGEPVLAHTLRAIDAATLVDADHTGHPDGVSGGDGGAVPALRTAKARACGGGR